MLGLSLVGVRTVLLLGAHADDIEIGCGGTVRSIVERAPGVNLHWHVFSAPGERRREAQESARDFVRGAGGARITVSDFRESYFPAQWGSIKDAFERIKEECDPDLVLTHWGQDRHQDHRVLSELTWNTFRSHAILEYEIPKYDGDLGSPNVYVPLDEAVCREKATAILKHFRTQAGKHWFTEDTLMGLMRLRGVECGPRARFAEAFYGRKLVL